MAQSRIYLIEFQGNKHLVKAINRTIAVAYIAEKHMSVEVASQEKLIEMLNQGVTVESTVK